MSSLGLERASTRVRSKRASTRNEGKPPRLTTLRVRTKVRVRSERALGGFGFSIDFGFDFLLNLWLDLYEL